MKQLLNGVLSVVDACVSPLVLPSAAIMRLVRRVGVERLPVSRRILRSVGVFPIADHYYEPLTNFSLLHRSLDQPRHLPGVDLNIEEQLALLKAFHFGEELRPFTAPKRDPLTYSFGNGFFDSGDAEFLYNLVRLRQPRRVVEIGSGNSTLLVIEAIRRNRLENPQYNCQHICIEPYEMPWLEQSGVQVVRKRVESVEPSLFRQLQSGDLLFIDSSHVIRPQGDVLFEFLEILPILQPGVVVHIHDIFTPRDYPKEWVVDKVRLWNEQYLLEAILTESTHWKVIGALNLLKHEHFDQLRCACPFLTSEREPASFYIERIR